jgi:hypothetical protein
MAPVLYVQKNLKIVQTRSQKTGSTQMCSVAPLGREYYATYHVKIRMKNIDDRGIVSTLLFDRMCVSDYYLFFPFVQNSCRWWWWCYSLVLKTPSKQCWSDSAPTPST